MGLATTAPVGSKISSLSASALRWTASFHEPEYFDLRIHDCQYLLVSWEEIRFCDILWTEAGAIVTFKSALSSSAVKSGSSGGLNLEAPEIRPKECQITDSGRRSDKTRFALVHLADLLARPLALSSLVENSRVAPGEQK